MLNLQADTHDYLFEDCHTAGLILFRSLSKYVSMMCQNGPGMIHEIDVNGLFYNLGGIETMADLFTSWVFSLFLPKCV